jgi:hypothetical protein
MLLPVQYAWFEPVLIATIVVFIIDLVGNSIGFGNRFLSALMSAIVFALVFGTLVYFGYGSVSMSVTTTPSTTAPVAESAKNQLLRNFRSGSIFDFCNTIPRIADMLRDHRHVSNVPMGDIASYRLRKA